MNTLENIFFNQREEMISNVAEKTISISEQSHSCRAEFLRELQHGYGSVVWTAQRPGTV